MSKHTPYIALILLLLAALNPSFAQPATHVPGYDFHPMQQVIFEDNFSQDSVGKIPSRWEIVKIGEFKNEINTKYIHVEKEGNGKEIVVPRLYQPRITPTGFPDEYLPDSFTLEFNFFLDHEDNNLVETEFNLIDEDYGKTCFGIQYNGKLWIWDTVTRYSYNNKYYPGHFDTDFWHHFAIYYNQGKLKWYVDQHCLYDNAKINFIPHIFNVWLCGPAKMRNFRLATGIPRYEFEQLATEKKLVTHAINFDFAKSTVKPESKEFIRQLARYLIDHPTLKLEIDGHSDNDGSVVSNEKLSLARAGEVKRQLVLSGVGVERLTAKGFGSSKPLKPGNSAADKAENRRVEFIVK